VKLEQHRLAFPFLGISCLLDLRGICRPQRIFYALKDTVRLEAISDGVRHIVLPQGVRHKLLLLSPRKPSPANVQKSALLAREGVFVDQRPILPPTHMMGNTEENHPLRENVALERRREPVEYPFEGRTDRQSAFFLARGTFTRYHSPYKSVLDGAGRPCIPRE
jgi:hypothetical protein